MNCPSCGAANENGATFCANCGSKMMEDTVHVQIPTPPVPPVPPIPPVPPVTPQPTYIPTPVPPAKQEIPEAYKPMSPWAYVGWRLLFMIPVVGFVLLIVMSFAPRNKNLKNFTRSYWCMVLLGLIIAAVIVVIAIVAGVGINELMQYIS